MARHTPRGDASFTLSLARHLGAAVALVVVVAAAFWGIGQVQGGDAGDPVAAGSPPTPSATTPAATPSDGGATPTAPADVATPAPPRPSDEPPSGDPTADVTPPPEPSPEPTASEPVPGGQGDVDPAEISVQVLDAVLDDGGEAAARVADQLSGDGFRVVARNQAIRRYAVTTVMYTPGNEGKAQQIAARYGYDRVEPQPGNLSDSVDVHLVVGADA
jgi:hypothetical protein